MPEILNSGLVEINSNTVDKVFELFHSHPLNSIPYWKGMHTLSSIKIPPKANEKSLFIPSGYTRILIFLLRVFFFSSPREHEEKQRDWNFSNTIIKDISILEKNKNTRKRKFELLVIIF